MLLGMMPRSPSPADDGRRRGDAHENDHQHRQDYNPAESNHDLGGEPDEESGGQGSTVGATLSATVLLVFVLWWWAILHGPRWTSYWAAVLPLHLSATVVFAILGYAALCQSATPDLNEPCCVGGDTRQAAAGGRGSAFVDRDSETPAVLSVPISISSRALYAPAS